MQDAKKEMIKDFPMDLAVPFVFMFYATQFAQDVKFEGKAIQLDFSLSHLNLLRPKQQKLLKTIVSQFDKETNKKGDEMLGQFYIDDNAFNSFASVATTVEKMFSARDLMKKYPNSQKFLGMLTTSTIGAVMPQFTEEYGENKKIDIVFSPSHELFLDGVPESKMTGVYMDKNGNWKVQLNIPF